MFTLTETCIYIIIRCRLGTIVISINVLKGLKLASKIFVSDFNVSQKTNQYGISRVSDSVDLIEQLENKFTE